MAQRRRRGPGVRPRGGGFGATALLAVAVLINGCAAPGAPSVSASSTPPAASGGTASLPPAPTGGTASSPEPGGQAFPPPQTPIAAGTYQWDGFERWISVSLGPGWALGHDNPSFFDLFRGSDFPSISFARFTDVYVDATHRAAAADASTVAGILAGRTDMTVRNASAIELGGLRGRLFDLTTVAPMTPLFLGPAGDFKLDPEFKTRYRILDFPGGGILVVGIHARAAGFEDGVALGDPVVSSLAVEP
jgi:hypothetical protein